MSFDIDSVFAEVPNERMALVEIELGLGVVGADQRPDVAQALQEGQFFREYREHLAFGGAVDADIGDGSFPISVRKAG
jgi:hypothetical protein